MKSNNSASKFPQLNLKSLKSLARAIDVEINDLRDFALSAKEHYRPFKMKTKRGKIREIDNPSPALKKIQTKIDRRLLAPHINAIISFGAIKKRSHVDAALLHCKKQLLAKIDIKDFFPSISNHDIYMLFIKMNCSPDVSRVLTQFLTFNGHLPQGSPASCSIANLILSEFDLNISAICDQLEVSPTRFIDDIGISGGREMVIEALNQTIQELNRCGFRLNREKFKLEFSGGRQTYCGLVVNKFINVKKEYRNYVRSSMRAQNRYKHAAKMQSLNGMKNYILYVESRRNPNLPARFEDVDASGPSQQQHAEPGPNQSEHNSIGGV